ncbi:hypothetical protein [Ensifer soli]|uniref:hypothetical protein n=1 Tax=Ciceribacter sp. sgz301302 TaxID=3342379 RepID=UPI0035BAA1D8
MIAGPLGVVATAFGAELRRPVNGGRMFRPSDHVDRFIPIALSTATRHKAVLAMRWSLNPDGGWFDLENEGLHRRGDGQVETSKRRPPTVNP